MDGTEEMPVKASCGAVWGQFCHQTRSPSSLCTQGDDLWQHRLALSSPVVTNNAFGLKLLDRLRDEQRISAAAYESIFHRAKRSGESVQELIIDTGAMSEHDLLKAVAHVYQTRFVSTERLAKAGIDRQTLQMVPRRVCERYQCCPVVFDAKTQSLAIVVADLDEDIPKHVQVVTTVREVKAYIARPAAIVAAIKKYYGGDPMAFSGLIAESRSGLPPPMDERGRPDTMELAGGFGEPGFAAPPARPAARPRPAPPRPISALPPASAIRAAARTRAPSVVDMGRFEPPSVGSLGSFEAAPDYATYLETVKVLVTLVDQSRGELRGHSAHVASVCAKILQRVAVPEAEKNAILVAAHLHDIGKTTTAYHLTALNVSRFDGHRIQAEKSFDAPTKLLGAARLSDITVQTLDALYERWDGLGFPKKLENKFIPMGARILSMAETYCDLTTNAKNPYRRVLTPREAVEVIRQLGGQLFDPALVDPLRLAVGADRHTMNQGVRARILLVDADADWKMMLEMRFSEQGYEVTSAGSRAEAEGRLRSERFDILLTEVDLEGGDGFGLVGVARNDERNAGMATIFLTKRADRDAVARGLDLGAADYMTKPVAPEVVVMKTGQIFEAILRKKNGGGLSGALKDMSLAEVVQILGQGRKTGGLRITAGQKVGEVFFLEGLIAHATFQNMRGEEAFYSLMTLAEGDFRFTPDVKSGERSIQAQTETLLLEAMRRLDEGI
jgi:response regulator RpfG family c-di-GMP phosphodiesterase